MQPETRVTLASARMIWTGRILSTVAVLFLLFDSVIHIMKPVPVVEAFNQLGLPLHLAMPLGFVELLCIIVYVLPRSRMLGAILLTGYLGGAVATHVRVGNPVFETIFPVIIGSLIWGGLYLRDGRLRECFAAESVTGK